MGFRPRREDATVILLILRSGDLVLFLELSRSYLFFSLVYRPLSLRECLSSLRLLGEFWREEWVELLLLSMECCGLLLVSHSLRGGTSRWRRGG